MAASSASTGGLAGLLGDDRERVVDDPLGGRPLAVEHDAVDELGHELRPVDGVGLELARAVISARRGITSLLRSVLRAALLAVGDAGRVERGADHLVADARQVLDAAAADQHDRVLLQVVTLARDVGRDLHPVRQPHARDLAQRRVRLLRGRRVDARADAALLRRPAERRRLRLRLRRLAALADELVCCRHAAPGSRVACASRAHTATVGRARNRPANRTADGSEDRRESANRAVPANGPFAPTASRVEPSTRVRRRRATAVIALADRCDDTTLIAVRRPRSDAPRRRRLRARTPVARSSADDEADARRRRSSTSGWRRWCATSATRSSARRRRAGAAARSASSAARSTSTRCSQRTLDGGRRARRRRRGRRPRSRTRAASRSSPRPASADAAQRRARSSGPPDGSHAALDRGRVRLRPRRLGECRGSIRAGLGVPLARRRARAARLPRRVYPRSDATRSATTRSPPSSRSSRCAPARRSTTRAASARRASSPTSTRSPACTTAATSTRRSPREVARAQRYSRSLALVVFDLDDFKAINDRHRPPRRATASSRRRRAHARRRPLGGRRLPRRRRRVRRDPARVVVDGRRSALQAARARRSRPVRSARRDGCTSPPASRSCGPTTTRSTLFERADEALYRAKDAGKGTVVAVGRARTPTQRCRTRRRHRADTRDRGTLLRTERGGLRPPSRHSYRSGTVAQD